ncbi:MAG: hypothetical protein IEMM0008_0205 [bacterium]|nr:MAG: hypothetical protein IEMM0008_0205 [bacterium]
MTVKNKQSSKPIVIDKLWINSKILLIDLKRWVINLWYLFITAFRKFYDDECFGKASSISYITILSVVPVLILIYSIGSSLELTRDFFLGTVNDQIIHYFFPAGGEQEKIIANYLGKFTINVATVSIFGIILLLVVAIDIVLTLEGSINSIWRVKKGRGILQNMLIYWTMLTLGPLFLVISFYVTSKFSHDVLAEKVFSQFFFPLLVTWIGFFLAYQLIPRTKVTFKAAAIGALIAGTLWEIAKFGYGFYIKEVGSQTLGLLYGPLYFIPISIAWIYLSFALFFLGAEISYLIQYSEIYKKRQYKKLNHQNFLLYYLLNSLYRIYQAYENGKGSITLGELSRKNSLSRLDMEQITQSLVNKGFIRVFQNGFKKEYFPLKPMDKAEITGILDLVTDRKQLLLNKNNTRVKLMFDRVVKKLEDSHRKEFANLSYKDLLEE